MRALHPRQLSIAAAVIVTLLMVSQINLTATQAAGNRRDEGTPGPTAAGERVDSHRLVPIPPGETPQQLRDTPHLFPVDSAAFSRLKSAEDAAAAARDKGPTSTGISSGPAPKFASLDFNQTGGWNPPDAGLAVGSDSILVAVNEAYSIYNKSGSTLQGPNVLRECDLVQRLSAGRSIHRQ